MRWRWTVGCRPGGDGPIKRALVGFLHSCVRGPEAVAPDERVAAFDNDGTVACEKPLTALAAFLLDHDGPGPAPGPGGPVAGGGHQVMREVATRFAGQTTEAYQDAARNFLRRGRHPRFDCPYPQVTYRPMLELIALLQLLEFSVFLCTDSSQTSSGKWRRRMACAGTASSGPRCGSTR